jgi:hypothetical protein
MIALSKAQGKQIFSGAQSPAPSEQWCCLIGRSRIILDPGNSCHLRDAQLDDQRPRENALVEILALGPSCVCLTLQLKRE